jgi:CPA2 family monovalent cation:H+ antiporter-2
MTGDNLFLESLVVILACAGTVIVFARFGFPTVLAYLVAGLAIGPHGLGILSASEGVRFLAELGVIFLLFMVGLEFSLSKLIAARRIVFGAGGLHVGVTTVGVAAGAILLGFDTRSAVLLGGAVAMSSTAVVLKQLADQGELTTVHGHIAVGILLFEDLVALLFLILVDIWGAGSQTDALDFVKQLAIATLAFSAVAFVSRPLFSRVVTSVARLHSNEGMLLSILSLALGTAFLTHGVGLSPPIGAFLAGMVIGETDFRHQIEDDIRPFRDLLLGLFFVTVGMEIDLSVITGSPQAILIWLALFAGKGIIITGVVRAFGWPTPVAARTGACLAQGSEFGLLLLTLAMRVGIVNAAVGQPALAAVAISMGVAPLVIQRNEPISRVFGGREHRASPPGDETVVRNESAELEDHVLLLGCGRVGRLVAAVFEAARFPYLALENDSERFQHARQRGHRIVLADASRARSLDAAGLRRSRLLVITFDHRPALERILHHCRREKPELPTLVSIQDDRDMPRIIEAGASVVYPENLAAGLALGDQALVLLGLSHEEAAEIVKAVRAGLNPKSG